MEPEPTLVPAEPIHEPEDGRGVMRQKIFANIAAVGGLADLCDLAHKLQPDLVPANVTMSEDTVSALLRAVIALTLVPARMEVAPPAEIPSPPTQAAPQPTQCESAAQRLERRRAEIAARNEHGPETVGDRGLWRHQENAARRKAEAAANKAALASTGCATTPPRERPRMMHTPSWLETDTQTAIHRQREADAVQMAMDTSMLPGSGASLPPLSVYANDSTGTQRGDEAWISQYDAERARAVP